MSQSFYAKLDFAYKQIRPWGIFPKAERRVPPYSKASFSAYEHQSAFQDELLNEINKYFPENLDFPLKQALIEQVEHPLSDHHDIISRAAKRDDVGFFVSLGKVLSKYKAKQLPNTAMLLGPKSYPHLIAHLWMSGGLWLMTDTAALEFLNKVFNQDVKLPTYRVARRRLHLVSHPDKPVVAMQWPKGAIVDESTTSSVNEGTFCTPALKRGWSIVDGKLTKDLG